MNLTNQVVAPLFGTTNSPSADLERSTAALKERVRVARRNAVKACVSVVREQTDARLHKGFSRFDAYVTGEYGDTYNYFGTADERFQFEKCMAERGVVLSTSTEKGKK